MCEDVFSDFLCVILGFSLPLDGQFYLGHTISSWPLQRLGGHPETSQCFNV